MFHKYKGLYYSLLLSSFLIAPQAGAIDLDIPFDLVYPTDQFGITVTTPYANIKLISNSGNFNQSFIGTKIGIIDNETMNFNGGSIGQDLVGLSRGFGGAVNNKIELNINGGTIQNNVIATRDLGSYNGTDRRISNTINFKGGTIGKNIIGGGGANQNVINITGGKLGYLDNGGNNIAGTIYAGTKDANLKNKSTNALVNLADMTDSSTFIANFVENSEDEEEDDNNNAGMIFGSNVTGTSELKFDGINGRYFGGFKDFDTVTFTQKSALNNNTSVTLSGKTYNADTWNVNGILDTNGKTLHTYKNSNLMLNVGATGSLSSQFLSDANVIGNNLGSIKGIKVTGGKNITLTNAGTMTGSYDGNQVQITNNLGGTVSGNTTVNSLLPGFINNSGIITGILSLSGSLTLNNQNGGNIHDTTVNNNQPVLNTNNSGTMSNVTFVNADDSKVINLNNQSGGEITNNLTIREGTMNLNNQSGGKIHDANITSNSATLNIDNNGRIYGTNSLNSLNLGVINLTNNTNGELTGILNVNGGLNNFLNKGNYHDLTVNNKQAVLTLNNQGLMQGNNSFNNDTDAQIVNINNQTNGRITGNLTVKDGILNLNNQTPDALITNATIRGNSAAVNLTNSGQINGVTSVVSDNPGQFINHGLIGQTSGSSLTLGGKMTVSNEADGTMSGNIILNDNISSFVNKGRLGSNQNGMGSFSLVNNTAINSIDNYGIIDVEGNSYNKFTQNGLLTLNNKNGATIRGGLEMVSGDLTINNESGAKLLRPNMKGTADTDFIINNGGQMLEGFTMTEGKKLTLNNESGGSLTGQNYIYADTEVNNAAGATMDTNQFYSKIGEFNINNEGLTNNIEVLNQTDAGIINFNNKNNGKLTGYFGAYDGTVNLNNDNQSTIKDVLFVSAGLFNNGNDVLGEGLLNINNAGTFTGSNRLYGVLQGNINLNNLAGGDMSGNMEFAGFNDPVYTEEEYFLNAHITNQAGGNLHDFNITNRTAELLFDNSGTVQGTNSITSDSNVIINNNDNGSLTGSLKAIMPELIVKNNGNATVNATLETANVMTLVQNAANNMVVNALLNSGGAIVNQALNLTNNNASGSINATADANIKDLHIDNKGTVNLALNANSHIIGNISGTNNDDVKIDNSGKISGTYNLSGGTSVLNNLNGGLILSETFNVASGTLAINNSGSIAGNNSFTGTTPANISLNNLNGGNISGNMTVVSGLNKIDNLGTINGLALNNQASGGFTIDNKNTISGNNSITSVDSATLNNTGSGVVSGNLLLNAPTININQSSSVALNVALLGTSLSNTLNLTNNTVLDSSVGGNWGNINLNNNNTTTATAGATLGNTGVIGGTLAINNSGNTIINNSGNITGTTTINNGGSTTINNTGNMTGNVNDSTSPELGEDDCPDKTITINNSTTISGNVSVMNNILAYNNTASGMVTSNHIDARDLRLNNAGNFNSDISYLFNVRDHMNVVNSGNIYGRDYAFMLSGDKVTGTVNNTGTIWSQGITIGYNGQNLKCPDCYTDKTLTLTNSGRIVSVDPTSLTIPDLESYAIKANNMDVINQSGGIIGGSMDVKSYAQQSGSTWIAFLDKDKTQMSNIHAKEAIDINPDSTLFIYTNNDVKAFTDGQKFKLVTADAQQASEIDNEIENFTIKTDSPFANYTMESLGHDGFLVFNNVAPTEFAAATDLTTANHNNTILGSHRMYELFVNRDTENGQQGMSSGDDMSGNSINFLPLAGYAKQDNDGRHAGYETSYYGGIGYVEHDFSKDVKGGLGLAYMRNDTDYNDSLKSKSDINTYRPFAYINYEPGNWRFDLAAGWAKHKVDNNRYYSFNDNRYLAKSKYDADEISGHLNIGYKFMLDNDVMIQPMVGAYAARLETDSYNEKGHGPMNMHVSSDNYNSFKSMLGVRMKKEFAYDNGVKLTPELHMRWYHELGDTQGGVTSYFLAQEQLFNTKGIKAPKDIGDIALRLKTNSGGKWDLFTEAYYQFGKKFYNAGGTIGVQYNL